MDDSKRIISAAALTAGLVALLIPGSGTNAADRHVGLVSDRSPATSLAADEWQWSQGDSGTMEVLDPDRLPRLSGDAIDKPGTSLLIVDNVSLSDSPTRSLTEWVHSGGTLLLAGPRALESPPRDDAEAAPNRLMFELAGLKPGFPDPGQTGIYPRLVSTDSVLSPFVEGDGIRLGRAGLGHASRVRIVDARMLARSFRIRPGPDGMIQRDNTPTITTRTAGDGRVLYLAFSPGEVAACYPDESGAATDCSAAGTAHALMRQLVANLLWEDHRIQWPLPWENPGPTRLGVVITGDVHMQTEDYQIRSAVQMARQTASMEVPVTWFIVGEVARKAADHYRELTGLEHVEIATHSVRGDQYRADRLEGAGRVRDDIRTAERMLGLPAWPEQRTWRSAIRTEAWASDQTRARAWEGMAAAGIGLVFDHNADALLPRPQWTAPKAWFRAPARERLFLPVFEKNVTTAVDNFRLSPDLERQIASLGSPEPDPCCNHAMSFESYLDYVQDWHGQFRRLGVMGGLTAIWLWHPSTPGWKGGLDALESMLREWRADPEVRFFQGSEVATWQYNRRQVRVTPEYGEAGHLDGLKLDLPTPGSLLPLPPSASSGSASIGYWVLGKASPPGWRARTLEDVHGRTITLMRRDLPLPEQEQ